MHGKMKIKNIIFGKDVEQLEISDMTGRNVKLENS